MKKTPLASVNIRTYNSQKTLAKALQSVENQTYKNIEILVSDGYSSDDSVEIAKEYGAKVDYADKLGDARIQNYRKSKGKYILSLDSDQILDKDLIEKCVSFCEREKLDAVSIAEKSLITKGTLIERLIGYDKWVIDKNKDDDSTFGTACPRFFKRSFLDKIRWPAQLSIFDDTILYAQLLSQGAKVDYLATTNIWHHEVTSWLAFFKKFHQYGKGYIGAFRKKPTTIAAHSLPRRSYFSKAAFSKPGYFLGLIVLYTVKVVAASSGVMLSMLNQTVVVLGVIVVVLLSYLKVLSGFFQQDEWLSFGYRFLSIDGGLAAVLKDTFVPSVGHYQPLTTLAIYLFFSLFGLNYIPYAAVSIILHLVCTVLVFALAKLIFRNLGLSAATALIFGVSVASYQATSWVLADTSIHFSTIFALLSLLLTFKFFVEKRELLFKLSLAFLVISLLFKEITIGLFVLIPFAFLVFSKEPTRSKKRYIASVFGVAFFYVVFRLSMIFIPQSYARDTLVTQSQPLANLLYNAVTLPFKGIVQSLVPPRIILESSYFISNFLPDSLTGQKDTTAFDRFVQGYVLEVLSGVIFLILSFLAFSLLKKAKRTLMAKSILFGLALVFVSMPIFALTPEKAGRISIIDSRNLYFASIGSSIFLVSLLKARKMLVLFALVFFLNVYLLNRELGLVAQTAEIRKDILSRIVWLYPQLPEMTVFYTESDSSYYGLAPEEKVLPFQSGFGQTLLVWYHPRESFPKAFFADRFLWEIKDQGYEEFEGRGWGYFRNFNLLSEVVDKYGLREESVFAFSWRSGSNTLDDITDEVRGRLGRP